MYHRVFVCVCVCRPPITTTTETSSSKKQQGIRNSISRENIFNQIDSRKINNKKKFHNLRQEIKERRKIL